MKEIIIRDIDKNDAARLFEINVESFSKPWSLEAMKKESKNKLASYKVAEIDGQIVAYAGFWLIMDEAEITNVVVAKDFRGNKISKLLMNELINEASKRGAVAMSLEVRSKNEIAKNLYMKLGFKVDGMRKNYYNNPKDDCFIMTLKL